MARTILACLAGCVWAAMLAPRGLAQEPAPAKLDVDRMAARIDALLAERWAAEGVEPAPEADDAEFLRRASLDLTGVIPTVAEVRRFLEESDPDKRARLIDRLVQSPAHPTHLANTWRKIMLPGGADDGQLASVAGLQEWLRGRFAENVRYDQIVADVMDATGGGPALFYQSLQVKPEALAANTARIFLGVQLQCAQCHKHPFDRWTQEDFWGFAAFFAQVKQPSPNPGPNQFVLTDVSVGEVTLPGTDTVVPPKYLGGREPDELDGSTRREQLALWAVSRDNPYLARAAVNWAWSHLFGYGLVEPVDDIGEHNPPSHPQLFDELVAYFVRSGYDLRGLLRTLARTKAYGLSSGGPEQRPELFARMAIKPLSAEQLYDSLVRASLRPSNGGASGGMMSRLYDGRRRAFVAQLQSQSRSRTEYEAGPLQALMLMNGPEITEATDPERSGLLMALEAPVFSDEQRVETLLLATLSRYPTGEERKQFVAHLSEASDEGNRPKRLGAMLWALLNSAEFTMNH